jgi:hypothetical protein
VADPVTSRLAIGGAALLCLAIPRAVRAQTCHAPAILPVTPAEDEAAVTAPLSTVATGTGLAVDLTVEKATVDLDGARGGWDGAVLGVGWRSTRLGARVSVPFYRVDEGSSTAAGLGDLMVEAQLAVRARPRLSAGVGLAVGLPTGDGTEGRGMGHLMVMPGLWASARRGAFDAILIGSFAHAIGADPHHVHHHGPTVNVNPMSPVEVAAGARLGVRATTTLTPRIGGSVALPIAGDAAARASALAGVAWRRAAWQLATDLELPVAGDAFDARGTVQITRWF